MIKVSWSLRINHVRHSSPKMAQATSWWHQQRRFNLWCLHALFWQQEHMGFVPRMQWFSLHKFKPLFIYKLKLTHQFWPKDGERKTWLVWEASHSCWWCSSWSCWLWLLRLGNHLSYPHHITVPSIPMLIHARTQEWHQQGARLLSCWTLRAWGRASGGPCCGCHSWHDTWCLVHCLSYFFKLWWLIISWFWWFACQGDGNLAMIAIRRNMPYIGLVFTEEHAWPLFSLWTVKKCWVHWPNHDGFHWRSAEHIEAAALTRRLEAMVFQSMQDPN